MTKYLSEAAKWYRSQPHQKAAWDALEESLNQEVLEHFKEAYRDGPEAPSEPSVSAVDNSWDGIYEAAKYAGAKYPECVAAQWALESAWGQHVSGKNNYFGIKGSGTKKTTWEDYGNGPVTIVAEFKDFDTPQDCINDLVTKWYKDYKGYKGVNRANSRDECAYLLKSEGYATDPVYPDKLIRLMNANA